MSRIPLVLSIFVAVISLIACPGQQGAVAEKTSSEPAAETEEPSDVKAIEMAAEFWSNYLNGYRKWDLFPGTVEMHESQGNPHGRYGTIYANLEAKKAVLEMADVMPEGAALARDNFDENKNFLKLTVMRKTKDGWFYAVYDKDGMVKAANIKSCPACHADFKRDHVFGWSKVE